MLAKCTLLVPILFLSVIWSSVPAAGTDERRDGNWWRTESEVAKLWYVAGFFDGMDLGNNFSYWGIAEQKSKSNCSGQAVESFSALKSRYLKNVTNFQIADGLDDFYKDYRNRRILVSNAVWLVINSIAGTPQKELDIMIENWRKNADTD